MTAPEAALEQITNYLEIRPDLGTAGQPTAQQFTAVREAGYEVVINLLPTFAPAYLTGEPDLVTGLGMEYLHIPVIWEHPTSDDLRQFFQAMRDHHGKKIFTHCAMNMRVSAFVFLYRVLIEQTPVETARQDMARIWEPIEPWRIFLEEQLNQPQAWAD
jgi:protein tyrosine phosphatase (PTP) superfamily phosphohydrolase (DUF442 family)